MKLYKKAILLLSGFVLLNGKPVFAKEVTVKISFVGDCTLGNDKNATYDNRFNNVAQKVDYDYFLENVKDVFLKDDYTVANLETTLTTESKFVEKQFNFKGLPEYTEILTSGGIDAVNISNNHTHDYGEKGYNDTISNLERANIDYSGDTFNCIKDIKGIKFLFIGFKNNISEDLIDKKFEEIKNIDYDYLVVSSHFGIEGDHEFNSEQQKLYHYLIDKGADIVIGHHPHVLQGIEVYQNKYIVYSLGNFCYGGHSNPKDKDTLIFQQILTFDENNLRDTDICLIPCSLSSNSSYNDFKPTILGGDEKERVLQKINKYSYNFSYKK